MKCDDSVLGKALPGIPEEHPEILNNLRWMNTAFRMPEDTYDVINDFH